MNGEQIRNLSDEELDGEIAYIYRWFAKAAPGVTVKEHGVLKKLWREFDIRVRRAA